MMEKEKNLRILVPESWNEVTIEKFQDIASIEPDLPPGIRAIELISILIDEDPEVVRMTDLESLGKIASHLEWTSKLPDEAWYKPVITIDGVEYGFVPRLRDLTVGEWIDMEHYIQDVNANIHKIFSVLYRPLIAAFNDRDRIIEPYTPEDVDRRAELFRKKVMIGDVYGALVFFSHIARECTRTMQDYLTREMSRSEEKTRPTKSTGEGSKKRGLIRRMVKSGCGMVTRMFWPPETSRKWMRFLKQTLSSHSTTRLSSKRIRN